MKIAGVNEIAEEFPVVIKIKSCGISMGLSFCLALEIPTGVTQFCEISKGKVTDLKIPVVFFKKICSQPSFFFWNSQKKKKKIRLDWNLRLK